MYINEASPLKTVPYIRKLANEYVEFISCNYVGKRAIDTERVSCLLSTVSFGNLFRPDRYLTRCTDDMRRYACDILCEDPLALSNFNCD